MRTLLTFLAKQSLGAVVRQESAWKFKGFWQFALAASRRMVSIGTYNTAVTDNVRRYLDHAVVYPLGLFLLLALGTGLGGVWLIFSFLADYGLSELANALVVKVMVREFSPLLVALFIALRMGPWIQTEFAVMKANGEFRALKAFGINIVDYLCVSRMAGSIISMLALTIIFNSVVVLANELFPMFAPALGAHYHLLNFADAIGFSDFVFVAVKCVMFGFFIAAIPIYHGLSTQEGEKMSLSVLRGIDRTLLTIFTLEGLSLALSF